MTDKVTHHIPTNALVEITDGPNAGARLWVIEHSPTVEGESPLYRLGLWNSPPQLLIAERYMRIIHDPDPIVDEAINDNQTEAC